MLAYTVCFICQGDRVLMLNREEPPLMGQWNGVGGKLEPGESPEEGVRREVLEETGLTVEPRYAGTVTWTVDGRFSGMYAYVADLPDGVELETPRAMPEGILDWKQLDWICAPLNLGVAQHIPLFLPAMLNGAPPREHRFTFVNWRVVAYVVQ